MAQPFFKTPFLHNYMDLTQQITEICIKIILINNIAIYRFYRKDDMCVKQPVLAVCKTAAGK